MNSRTIRTLVSAGALMVALAGCSGGGGGGSSSPVGPDEDVLASSASGWNDITFSISRASCGNEPELAVSRIGTRLVREQSQCRTLNWRGVVKNVGRVTATAVQVRVEVYD